MFELAFILLLLGLVLLAAGILGRRIGDEPRCKACGHDLSGLMIHEVAREAPDAIPCPECGEDLKIASISPGDLGSPIQLGRRVRRRGAIVLGLLLLLPSAGIFAVAGVMLAAGPSWNDRKPVTILIYEARRLRGSRADAAMTELYTRLIQDTATIAQQRAIINAALDVQESDDRRWFGESYTVLLGWGSLFDIAARQNTAATAEQNRRYARNALAIRFEHRSRARPGDQWPLGVIIERARIAGHATPFARPVLEEFSIGPWTLDTSTVVVTGSAQTNQGTRPTRFTAAVVPLGDLPFGRHEVRQKWSIDLHDASGGGINPSVYRTWTIDVTSSVLVVPSDLETVDVYDDADLEAAVSREFRNLRLFHQDGDPMRLELMLGEPLANLALSATIVGEHGERKFGSIASRQGDSAGMRYLLSGDWPKALGLPRRLRLQTCTDAARATPDLERILNLDLTLDLPGYGESEPE